LKKLIILLLGIAILNSCELDMQPESQLTFNGFRESEEAVRAAHTGIMAAYRGSAYTFFQVGELRSDVWGGNTIESPYGIDLIENNISTSIVPFSNWSNFYGLLHYVNDFIKNAPNVTFKKESDLNHLMGQVYGIRAHIYHTMVRAGGTYVFDEIATLDPSEAYKIYYSISQSMLANDSELVQTEGY